jgi:hypothetical protein
LNFIRNAFGRKDDISIISHSATLMCTIGQPCSVPLLLVADLTP